MSIYKAWLVHFKYNSKHFSGIDWKAKDILTERERSMIYSSLRQFQKGEHSEGKHLFAYAKKFPDDDYLKTIVLFIREEQTHARVLGTYLDIKDIPRLKHHWVDSVFRWLRKLSSLSNSLRVLLTAEIIAKVYYKALENATGSEILRQICRQIGKDEVSHIQFQCCTLNIIYHRSAVPGKIWNRLCQFFLVIGTMIVVWFYHRRVLSAGGFGMWRFFRSVCREYFSAAQAIYDGDIRRVVLG